MLIIDAKSKEDPEIELQNQCIKNRFQIILNIELVSVKNMSVNIQNKASIASIGIIKKAANTKVNSTKIIFGTVSNVSVIEM
jgi:hypothetical protein